MLELVPQAVGAFDHRRALFQCFFACMRADKHYIYLGWLHEPRAFGHYRKPDNGVYCLCLCGCFLRYMDGQRGSVFQIRGPCLASRSLYKSRAQGAQDCNSRGFYKDGLSAVLLESAQQTHNMQCGAQTKLDISWSLESRSHTSFCTSPSSSSHLNLS